eukprot:6663901-Ditylum_brightwellii.AAC.1
MGLHWYLSSDIEDTLNNSNLMDWLLTKHQLIKEYQDDSWGKYVPSYDHYDAKHFDTAVLPYEAFSQCLSEFDEKDDGPKSFSLIVAVQKSIRLTIPKGLAIIFHQHLLYSGSEGTNDNTD